ncbi:MAG: HEAT repeat domain-containing protein [Phycisphaeraceae bacterium]
MDALYHHIQTLADPSVDRAMAAALPTADTPAIRRIAPLLLERDHPEGTLGLVMQYHRLPADLQARVVDHVPRLFRPLREAAGRRQGHGPANVIALVQRARNTRLAYLVSEQLRHGAETLHAPAGGCLLALAELAASDPRPDRLPSLDAEAAAYLQTAIAEAVQSFPRHHQPAVLLALAWLLPRPFGDAQPPLAEAKSATATAMSTQLRRADHLAARRALLAMLALPAQAEAAMDGLRRCGEQGLMGDVLGHHHLLLLPAVRKPLARLKQVEKVWPSEPQREAMELTALRGLPAWLDALPVEPAQRQAMLTELCEAADPATRLAVLRRLLALTREQAKPGQAEEEVTARIVAFCHDPEPALARIALRHLIATQYPTLPRLLTRLVSSPHESVRRIASEQLAPLGFARLWALWPRLESARRLAAAQALMKIDPHFHHMVGEKLKLADRTARLRALSMIEQLNQGPFFEPVLQRLCSSDDERIASAAVRALGSAESASATASVEQALEHPDSRVRANAVEALEQLGEATDDTQLHRLMVMAEREDNRPRANAIHAMMLSNTGEAMRALAVMLNDDRPEHRASALWVVREMGLLAVARQVAEMSLRDPDDNIRQRADDVVRELVERLAQQQPDKDASNQGKASAG